MCEERLVVEIRECRVVVLVLGLLGLRGFGLVGAGFGCGGGGCGGARAVALVMVVVVARSGPGVVVFGGVGDDEHGGVHAASLYLLPCRAAL